MTTNNSFEPADAVTPVHPVSVDEVPRASGADLSVNGQVGSIEQADDSRPLPVFDASARHRDLKKQLTHARFAARLNAETIAAQSRYIRELEGKLARVLPNLQKLYRDGEKIMVPTLDIRDTCIKCNARYLPERRVQKCACGYWGFVREAAIPEHTQFSEINWTVLTPDEWAGLHARVALGQVEIVPGVVDDDDVLVIREVEVAS